VICLTRLFENEIRLSVTQWLRKELGITMPKFFNRYQPGKKAIYEVQLPGQLNPKRVNFNKSNEWLQWQPPPIGQTYYSFEQKNPDNILDALNRGDISILKPKWNEIVKLRNRCVHAEHLDKNYALNIIDALNKLADSKIFDKLHQLECRFRESRKSASPAKN
jgi:hypothetical protein